MRRRRGEIREDVDRRFVRLLDNNVQSPLMRPLGTLMSYHSRTIVMLRACEQLLDLIEGEHAQGA